MIFPIAIVIPAYKIAYLEETIESFAKQTCKDFVLYIFDDCSPYDIKSIADKYKESLNIHYYRFEENLGGKDLVAHWNRCIKRTMGEEWVWLFSDDDKVQPKCVEIFYEYYHKGINAYSVLHFNIEIINEKSLLKFPCKPYPKVLMPNEFLYQLYRGKIAARLPEFIFKKAALDTNQGYEHYDLAWRADNATVMKLSYPLGIFTLDGDNCLVQWRNSNDNISACGDKDCILRKNEATILFFNWAYSFYKHKQLALIFSDIQLIATCVNQLLIVDNRRPISSLLIYIYRYVFIKEKISRRIIAFLYVFYRLIKKRK